MAMEPRDTDFGTDVGGVGRKAGLSEGNAGKVAERLHNVVDQATDRASDFAQRARTSFDGWIRDLGAAMERHPIATIFIGFGAGYMIAKLRRRD